ncbi:MAG: hypothetical protein WAV95_07710 [Azonexus sp.]
MKEKLEPACCHCRYFKVGDALTGICHRFPPVFTGESSLRESHHWRFPVVSVHAWCGEFLLPEAV